MAEEQNLEQQYDLGEQNLEQQYDLGEQNLEQHYDLGEQNLEQHYELEEQNLEQQYDLEQHDLVNDIKEEDNVPEELHTSDLHQSDLPQSDLPSSEEVHEPEHNLVVPEDKKWPGWPGENVFRMLVPVQKVGGIIGRKGEYIKKICEETRARIKFLEGPPGITERAVMISAKEEPDLVIPPAIEGLLRIHNRIVDADSEPANAQSGKMVSTRLLVAATQAGSLIGKQGATIKSIQDSSGCTIRVIGRENLPVFALLDDSVVEIQGEPAGLHKAVELIAAHLRKFLVDRSVVGVFEMQMQMPNARAKQNIPPPQPWGPPPQGFSMNAGGGPGYGPPPQYMPPSRQFDSYYPPAEMPLEKQPRPGPPSYGRDVSAGSHTTSHPPQQSIVTKVSQNMQIPLSYADAVIGTSGANISYIRRSSGATIAVREGVPGEMTIEINGSASQVQAAQQLIQNFVADAASSAQNSAGGPSGQSYNPYANGPVYASPQSNTGGHGSHAAHGDYNPGYGSGYGY